MSQHDADLPDLVRKVKEALSLAEQAPCACFRLPKDELVDGAVCKRCSVLAAGRPAFDSLCERLGLDEEGATP